MPDIETPAVSVVVPTHLRTGLLREALDSIGVQTYRGAVEVVVVDDAADPATEATVHEMATAHPRLTVVYLQKRQLPNGASASRNIGVGATDPSTPLLAFLDDDDLWRPDFLTTLVGVLEQHPEVAMAVAGVDALGGGSGAPSYRMPNGLADCDVVGVNPGFTGSNFVIRRHAFEGLEGFDADLPVSNDKDFLVRFLSRGLDYIAVPEGLLLYREHDGPRLTNLDERRAVGVALYLDKHEDLLPLAEKLGLRAKIHGIRRSTARPATTRLAHAIAWVACELAARGLRRWRRAR